MAKCKALMGSAVKGLNVTAVCVATLELLLQSHTLIDKFFQQ